MPDTAPSCSCTFVRDWTCLNPPGTDGLCDYCRRSPKCRKHRGERDPAEGVQKGAESPDPTQDTRQAVGASQIDVGAVRNGMPTGPGGPQ